MAVLLVALAFAMAASMDLKCVVDLSETLTGPNSCTPEWATKNEGVRQCFHELSSIQYKLECDASSEIGLAFQQPDTCSKKEFSFVPATIRCNKTCGELPNACSLYTGLTDMTPGTEQKSRLWIALYAFTTVIDGTAQNILATRVVADAATVCSGTYKLAEGSCFGLGSQAGMAMAPPQPPDLTPYGCPVPFPQLDAEGKEVTTTERSTSTTTTANTGTTTASMTGVSTVPSVSSKPEAPATGSHGFWGALIVVLILVGVVSIAAVYVRRNRRIMEEERLRNSQDTQS